MQVPLLTLAALLSLLVEASHALPTNRGVCYTFHDLPNNGILIDTKDKQKLYQGTDGAWRRYGTNNKIIEWEFYQNPIKIVNHGISTKSNANIIQIMMADKTGAIGNYWFDIGRGDQCQGPKDTNLIATFANPENKVKAVWHYPLARWP